MGRLWCQTGRQVDGTSRGQWGSCGVRRVGRWTGQVEVSGATVVSDGSAGFHIIMADDN